MHGGQGGAEGPVQARTPVQEVHRREGKAGETGQGCSGPDSQPVRLESVHDAGQTRGSRHTDTPARRSDANCRVNRQLSARRFTANVGRHQLQSSGRSAPGEVCRRQVWQRR